MSKFKFLRWAVRWLLRVVIGLTLLVALALAGVWFWTGTDASLATSLTQAARWLPAGQTLEAQQVEGSLREGGKIALLRWRNNGLTVQARNITLGWQLAPLVNRQLTLDKVSIGQLIIDDQRPNQPDSPLEPLQSLVLPLAVDIGFGVDDFQLKGAASLQLQNIKGHYQYDRQQHQLDLTQLQMAQGRYTLKARLQDRGAMALDASATGQVQAPVPGGKSTVTLDAQATVRGPLAGAGARLDVTARVHPAAGQADALQAMRLNLTAAIAPWALQPVLQANSDFSQIDLALLWPQAPRTGLSGQVRLEPDPGTAATAQAWQAQVRISNTASGPWDQQRLPLASLVANLRYAGNTLQVQTLTAALAGGQVTAKGQLVTGIAAAAAAGPSGSSPSATSATTATTAAIAGWQGELMLSNINPAQIDTRLEPARLSGRLQARQVTDAIAFEGTLTPTGPQPATSPLRGLRLKSLLAEGRFSQGRVQVQTLRLQASDAVLTGQLEVLLASGASSADLVLTAPGARAGVKGRISASDGAGDFQLKLAEAGTFTRWLGQLPGMPAQVRQTNVQGQLDLAGSWQGGWAQQGRNIRLQAALQVPTLDIQSPAASPGSNPAVPFPTAATPPSGKARADAPLRLRDVKLDLQGSLAALELQLTGLLDTGAQRLNLQTRVNAGQRTDGAILGQIQQLRASVHDSFRPGTWTVQLQAPTDFARQADGTLQLAAGRAQLTGPAPGTATLAWDTQRFRNADGTLALSSKGQLTDLPIGWIEVLSDTPLASLGLAGSMAFEGQWDLQLGEQVRASASFQRSRGDLRVLVDAEPASTRGLTTGTATGTVNTTQISAGIRQASLNLTSDGSSVSAALVWDSDNAGNINANVSTRLTRDGNGWRWADDAPLAGTLRARLPKVGVWSVLAPPGWRIRGTLEANAQLSGNRRAPQWTGTLLADDLALRSVVDGIEFSGGKMRASLKGDRLDLDEFSLRGAQGAGQSGGDLTIKGFVTWLSDAPAGTPMLQRLRMEMTATLAALRVSARADRRLSLSGDLKARLVDQRIELRGTLRADQALFILPDETAPSLGNDVYVNARPSASTSATSTVTNSTAKGVKIVPDVDITINLGDDFKIQGRGINTRIAGELRLQASPGTNAAPRLTGEVRTVRGTYRAYGQYLTIEEGVLRFNGPFDNPALDILAIRPNLTQRVGVQISGSAQAPRVRLYASPDLPDTEKLAWLVLGRSSAGGGAEAAVLQQAAMALLGGQGEGLSGGLAKAIGLDELSFRGSGSNADGTTSGAAVTFGKRLSRDFYVAYERGLASTMGTFYIFYDLSQRFTLRAQTGEQTAVDLIFTFRYD